MNMYEATIPQLTKMLQNLGRWLEAGTEHAKKKSFEPDVLLAARLAPDQYPLVRQVQVVCDSAKFIATRLTGKEPPAHPDTEKTMDELQARIKTCVDYLATFAAGDFDGAEKRQISLPWMEGKWLTGDDYLIHFALPNFYFHVTTAYAILRHNGVDVGKRDYIGSLPLHEPTTAAK
jgi:uncharacterized protein